MFDLVWSQPTSPSCQWPVRNRWTSYELGCLGGRWARHGPREGKDGLDSKLQGKEWSTKKRKATFTRELVERPDGGGGLRLETASSRSRLA